MQRAARDQWRLGPESRPGLASDQSEASVGGGRPIRGQHSDNCGLTRWLLWVCEVSEWREETES